MQHTWIAENNQQKRVFYFENYKAVMAFVNQVMQIAEAQIRDSRTIHAFKNRIPPLI